MTTFNPGGYQQRSGRLNMRVIIAAIIAIGGIVIYLSRTQINPVTGEKQHITMSVDQEKALGLQAAPQMMEQMGGAIDPATNPEAALVSEVGQKIISRSDARITAINQYLQQTYPSGVPSNLTQGKKLAF